MPEMVRVSREEFNDMKTRLPRMTAEQLFDTYRISNTTWRKMREGVPVKLETLEKIRERYRELANG